MTKRKNAINSFYFLKDNKDYCVTLKRLKNTTSGCPRYEATIIYLHYDPNASLYNAVYNFTGHYFSEAKEAEWILDEHLKED